MYNQQISKFCRILKNNIKYHNHLHRPSLDNKDYKSIKNTIKKGEVSTYGTNTNNFEKKLSNYLNVKNLVATINGTSSLHAILSYLKINSKDEVLVQTLTFVATINPILYLGASPHFIDSCPNTLAADPDKLENYLNSKKFIKKANSLFNVKTGKRIKILIITHIYGYPANIIKLKKIAKKYNLILIEDAAETIGSSIANKKLGTFGDFSFLSFNGNKTITTGSGGAIICKNKTDYKRIKHLITTSKINKTIIPTHDSMGFNYRMPSLNASLGISQLNKLGKILNVKLKIFKIYVSISQHYKKLFKIYNNNNNNKQLNNHWIVLMICENKKIRNSFLKISKKHKIQTRPIWKPMHKLKFLKLFPKMDLNVANNLSDRILCLPSSPFLKKNK